MKGAVPSWFPKVKWDTPSRDEVTPSPEAELFLWLARIVDDIEDDKMMLNFASGNEYNPSREKLIDDVCYEAFGSASPTR